MRRPLPLLPVVLAVAGFVVPLDAGPAQAAPSCHGQRPTIVGQPREVITGTQHRDVILTHGAKKVRSLGGDDLICVDDHSVVVTLVYSGAGDDSVFVSDPAGTVRYYGASGSDTYRSVASTDIVSVLGDGRDHVSTGPGGDNVGVRTAGGHDGVPTVDLGPGNDGLVFIGDASRGHFDGGGRSDTIWIVHKSKHVWRLDNRRGEAKVGKEVRFGWRGFENFDMSRLVVPEIEFRGSALDEDFSVEQKARTKLLLRMGRGDDSMFGGALGDLLDGGPGDDWAFGHGGRDTCAAEHFVDCEEID